MNEQELESPTIPNIPDTSSAPKPPEPSYEPESSFKVPDFRPIKLTEEPPPAEDPSFTGFFKNLGSNFVDLAKGLGELAYYIPDKLVKGGSEWVNYLKGNRDSIGHDFSGEAMDVIRQGMAENVKHIVKSTMDSYKEYGTRPLEKIYEHPLDVFMDVLTVADLGATATATFANRAAKSASLLGKAAEAEKWLAVAERAEKGGIGAFLKPMSESPVLKQVRKVPFIDNTLQAMHLTPESRTTASLYNSIVNKIQSTSRDRDIAELAVALQNIPEADRVENIFKVAMGQLPDSAITHPASRQAMELLRKMEHEQAINKIERGALTETQAANAPWVPLRTALAKVEIGKLRNAGLISQESTDALNFLLKKAYNDSDAKKVMRGLIKSGDLAVAMEPAEMKALFKSKDPSSAIRNHFAPWEDTPHPRQNAARVSELGELKAKIKAAAQGWREVQSIMPGTLRAEQKATKGSLYGDEAARAYANSNPVTGAPFRAVMYRTEGVTPSKHGRFFSFDKAGVEAYKKPFQVIKEEVVNLKNPLALGVNHETLKDAIVAEEMAKANPALLAKKEKLAAQREKLHQQRLKVQDKLARYDRQLEFTRDDYAYERVREEMMPWESKSDELNAKIRKLDTSITKINDQASPLKLRIDRAYKAMELRQRRLARVTQGIAQSDPIILREAQAAGQTVPQWVHEIENYKPSLLYPSRTQAQLWSDAQHRARLRPEVQALRLQASETWYWIMDKYFEKWAKAKGYDGIIYRGDVVSFAPTHPVADLMAKEAKFQGLLSQWQWKWKELNTPVMTKGVRNIAAEQGLKPFYLPLIHAEHMDVANAFLPAPLRQTKAAWMKKRTGAEGMITDVSLIGPIMRQQFRQYEAVNEFFRQFKAQPFVKNISAAVRDGSYVPAKGTMIFSDDAMRTFYKSMFDTQDRFAKNIKNIVGQHGEITNEAFKNAILRTLTPDLEAMMKEQGKRLGKEARIYEIPKDVGQLLTRQVNQISPLAKFVFDAPMDLLRVSALYLNPLWYIGNFFGNTILNMIGGVNPLSYARAGAKSFRKIVPEELRGLIESSLNTSFTQAERAKRGLTSLPPFRQMGKVNEAIEDWARSAHFMDQITKEGVKRKLITTTERMFAADEIIAQKLKPLFDEAAQRGTKMPEVVLGLKDASAVKDAIAHVNQWLFDYSNLHPVERNIIRRIVPFWTFMKNIHTLMLRLPVDRPLLSRAFGQVGDIYRHKLAQVAVDAVDDETLPDWLEGHAPIGFDKDGNFLFVGFKGLNPFGSFGTLLDPKKLATSTNPIIKAGLEYFGGKEMWSKKDLKHNEPVFDYSGRAYTVQLTPDGKTTLVRDTPSEGFIAQFAGQYSQVRLLRSLYNHFVLDPKYMKEGQPMTTPFMDNHGNWQYPTEVLDTALRFAGITLKRVNQEDLKTKTIMQKKNFFEGMRKQLISAPDDYKQFLIEAIRRAADEGLVEER